MLFEVNQHGELNDEERDAAKDKTKTEHIPAALSAMQMLAGRDSKPPYGRRPEDYQKMAAEAVNWWQANRHHLAGIARP